MTPDLDQAAADRLAMIAYADVSPGGLDRVMASTDLHAIADALLHYDQDQAHCIRIGQRLAEIAVAVRRMERIIEELTVEVREDDLRRTDGGMH